MSEQMTRFEKWRRDQSAASPDNARLRDLVRRLRDEINWLSGPASAPTAVTLALLAEANEVLR